MKKNILLLTILLLTIFITGCKQDNMDGIEIIVTNYPNEYVTKKLYGKHSSVKSIYPDGVDQEKYQLSKKSIEKYSKCDLFIYNGNIESDRDLALKLIDLNENLKIIDASSVITPESSIEELWLNPSYLLMVAQNIKTGLKEYTTSSLLKKEINKNHDNLKVDLSKLDADYSLAVTNTNKKNILIGNKSLTYLKKFGFNIYTLNEETTAKQKLEIKRLINNDELKYIYVFNDTDLSESAKELISNTDIKVTKIHKLDNISDLERKDLKDYISISNENLDLLKQEVYQ